MGHSYNFQDLTGKKFGRLIVIKFSHKNNLGKTFWACKCKCGQEAVVYSQKLKSGHTSSCGCIHKETVTKHGMSRTRFYRIWHAITTRCGREKNYLDIKVCKRWLKFENFRDDMLQEYTYHCEDYKTKNTTIDRINNNKDYKPSNCRWATYKVQNNNNKRNRLYRYRGKVKTITEWYDIFKPKVTVSCFYNRLINMDWSMYEAIFTPKGTSRLKPQETWDISRVRHWEDFNSY